MTDLRDNLTDALSRVVDQGERVVLERRGKGVAAIVSMDDLAILEALENREDLKAARKALAEMKRTGEQPIPWETVKQELGLQPMPYAVLVACSPIPNRSSSRYSLRRWMPNARAARASFPSCSSSGLLSFSSRCS